MVGSGTEYGQFDRIRPKGSDPSGSGTLGLTTPLAYPPLYLLSTTTAFYYWPGRRGSVPWGEHRPPQDPWWERRPWLSPHSGCCYLGIQVSERGFSSHLSQVAGEAEKKTFLVKSLTVTNDFLSVWIMLGLHGLTHLEKFCARFETGNFNNYNKHFQIYWEKFGSIEWKTTKYFANMHRKKWNNSMAKTNPRDPYNFEPSGSKNLFPLKRVQSLNR